MDRGEIPLARSLGLALGGEVLSTLAGLELAAIGMPVNEFAGLWNQINATSLRAAGPIIGPEPVGVPCCVTAQLPAEGRPLR